MFVVYQTLLHSEAFITDILHEDFSACEGPYFDSLKRLALLVSVPLLFLMFLTPPERLKISWMDGITDTTSFEFGLWAQRRLSVHGNCSSWKRGSLCMIAWWYVEFFLLIRQRCFYTAIECSRQKSANRGQQQVIDSKPKESTCLRKTAKWYYVASMSMRLLGTIIDVYKCEPRPKQRRRTITTAMKVSSIISNWVSSRKIVYFACWNPQRYGPYSTKKLRNMDPAV